MAWPSTGIRTFVDGETETAAIFNAHLRDALQSGPYATSITALNALYNGTPGGGATGVIQYGSTPYDLVPLVYNPNLGKWIGDRELVCSVATNTATTGTTYAVCATGPLMPHKQMTDAGLVMNVRVIAAHLAGATSTIGTACIAATGALNGALTLDTTHTNSVVSTTNTTETIQEGAWTALSGSITPTDYIVLYLANSRAGGANNGSTHAGTSLWFRASS